MLEPKYFDAVIQNGKIYERKYGRESPQIGVISEVYDQLEKEHNELVDSYNEYQNLILDWQKILLEKNIIDKPVIDIPLSAEEQIEQLLGLNRQQSMQIDALIAANQAQTNSILDLSDKLSKFTLQNDIPTKEGSNEHHKPSTHGGATKPHDKKSREHN